MATPGALRHPIDPQRGSATTASTASSTAATTDAGAAPAAEGTRQPPLAFTAVVARLATALVLVAIALATVVWGLPAWGATSDVVVLQRGARLFDNHCVGCHLNGGNIIRRGKTLRRQDLLREGVASALDVARIAAEGKGQMSGYGEVLGDGGADAVGAWVWKQAEQGWPRR